MSPVHLRPLRLASLLCLVFLLGACGSSSPATVDAGTDAGTIVPDGGSADSGTPDAGRDAGTVEDGGTDAGTDAGTLEDGGSDAGEQVGLCTTDNGGCDPLTTCSDASDGGVTCGACPNGYSGDGLSGCEDIDECTSIDPNCGGKECLNTEGGYLCVDPPTAVMLREQGRSSYIGSDSASRYWGQCASGQVIVGFSLHRRSAPPYAIDSVTPYCSDLTVSGASLAELAVHTTPPGSPGTDSRVCPQDEVVTGLLANLHEGAYGTEVESIAVGCAPLAVSLDGGTGPALTVGAPHSLELFPSGGDAVNASTECASGSVAYGKGGAGSQWLFGLALRCARPTFRADLPAIAFDSPVETPVIGASQQDVTNTDLCSDGGVVSGLMLESQWRSYNVRCSTPVLDEAAGVSLVNPETLPGHGSPAPSREANCGPAGAVAGFQVYAGSTYLYRLVLECAPLTASADAGTWTVGVSPAEAGPGFGQLATPDQFTRCPEGTAPIGMKSRTTTQPNDYVELSGVGLVCGTPSVP